MRFKPEFFLYQDLIGVEIYARPKNKNHPTWTDFRFLGIVIDETKNTLRISKDNKEKTYLKFQYIFRCWLPQPNGTKLLLQFDGDKIIGLPSNRIKQVKNLRRKYH